MQGAQILRSEAYLGVRCNDEGCSATPQMDFLRSHQNCPVRTKEVSENKYILKLKKMVIDFFKYDRVKIVLFGSRARGENYISSDVDIGIIPYGEFEEEKITLLKEKIEDLNIPYKVEIVNFTEVSKEFKQEALKDVMIWKD
jgi:predicted nucleotidyltransferase